MGRTPNRLRRGLATGAIVLGAGVGAAGIASAATSGTSSSSSTSTTPANPTTPPSNGQAPSNGSGTPPTGAADPAAMTHGPGETLLTGTDLQKATAAAQAAVPGATVIRAETDSSGASPYEVHMKKADGSYTTVELDSNFNAVKTVSGFGAGPAGGSAPQAPPAGTPSASGSPSA
jgi:hypothetical protein